MMIKKWCRKRSERAYNRLWFFPFFITVLTSLHRLCNANVRKRRKKYNEKWLLWFQSNFQFFLLACVLSYSPCKIILCRFFYPVDDLLHCTLKLPYNAIDCRKKWKKEVFTQPKLLTDKNRKKPVCKDNVATATSKS